MLSTPRTRPWQVEGRGKQHGLESMTDLPMVQALTLEDDDTRGVTISKTDLDIDEGNTGTYTVVLDLRSPRQTVIGDAVEEPAETAM